MELLQKKVGLLVVLNLSPNVSLEAGFIEKYDKRISPNAGLVPLMNSSPVAIVDETRHYHSLTINEEIVGQEDENVLDEDPCVVSLAVLLSPMNETMVEVKISTGGIQLLGVSDRLIKKKTSPGRTSYSSYCVSSSLQI